MKKLWWVWGWMLAALLLHPPEEAYVAADGGAQLPDEGCYVALTFDDGPDPVTTPALLDGLHQRGASATFFLVGERISGNEALVRRMRQEGHQVGNHTWSHKNLQEADAEAFRQEVGRVDVLLRQLLGADTYWVRPPYGQITAGQLKQAEVPLVKWSVDPRDWESRSADAVVSAVLEAVYPGSIILLHDIYPTSVEAALRLVDTLQAQGCRFVTVEELLYLHGIAPQAGTMYRAARGQVVSQGSG